MLFYEKEISRFFGEFMPLFHDCFHGCSHISTMCSVSLSFCTSSFLSMLIPVRALQGTKMAVSLAPSTVCHFKDKRKMDCVFWLANDVLCKSNTRCFHYLWKTSKIIFKYYVKNRPSFSWWNSSNFIQVVSSACLKEIPLRRSGSIYSSQKESLILTCRSCRTTHNHFKIISNISCRVISCAVDSWILFSFQHFYEAESKAVF